jgi:uncharacterized protein YndB with AHSA1/START domain
MAMTEAAGTTELVISRVFDAPRELVYQAFTDPDQLSQWFGPVGYSVPRDTVEIDARPGGRQRFVMVNDADPAETSPVDATFSEVIENELLVGYQDVEGIPGTVGTVRFTLRIELHDEGAGQTRLELRQGSYTPEILEGARGGWESSFTKLDALLKAA